MAFETRPIIRAVSRIIGIFIFLFAMWFLARYFSQKPKKVEKEKTDVINVSAWLIGLGGILLGIIFLFLVIVAITFTPEITLLRILLAIGGFLLAVLFIWSGYAFTRMAKGTWKKPEIPQKLKQSLHITNHKIEKIKRKNAQLSWYLIVTSIFIGYFINILLAKTICSTQKNCILSITLFELSLSIGIFSFVFGRFCRKYHAIGFLGNIQLLSEPKAIFWSRLQAIIGIVILISGILVLLYISLL